MKRVYSSDSSAMAWHIRNVLQQYDIEAEVRNSNLYSVAGELPITECQAEVWVPALYTRRAEQLIRELQQADPDPGPDWLCPSCGEDNLDTFALCWNCQWVREQEAPADPASEG